MIWWRLWKQRGFLMPSGPTIKHGQKMNKLLIAILLPSKVVLIKVEVNTGKTEPECQGNTLLAWLSNKSSSNRIPAACHTWIGNLCCFCKNDPLSPDFHRLDALWHSNSLVCIREITMGKQWLYMQGYGKPKTTAWFFLDPWQTWFFNLHVFVAAKTEMSKRL